jgi:calcineurin-like phosphoesterase family protein
MAESSASAYTADKTLITGSSGVSRWHALEGRSGTQPVVTSLPPLSADEDPFFTSDLHLGHALVSGLRSGLDADGHPLIDEHTQAVITNWNATVGPDDTVIILGDAAMGKLDGSLPLLSQLNGKKFLVPGNHDRMSNAYHQKGAPDVVAAKRAGWVARYEEEGGLTVLPEQIALDEFDLSHFPFSGDHGSTAEGGEEYEQRFTHLRPIPRGRPLLHGHVHEEWDVLTHVESGLPMVNVGLDPNGMRPVRLSAIREKLSRRSATDNAK